MTTVQDETELPVPENEAITFRYLRSKADPHTLIHGMTGVLYARADGQRWEHPAFKVSIDRAGRAVREIGTAYCDDARYRYAGSVRAA